jgi:type I restriction enzyme M protein
VQGRWRSFPFEELSKRDKLNLDIFWLKDQTLEDSESLPDPDVLADEIAEDMESALELFRSVARSLKA